MPASLLLLISSWFADIILSVNLIRFWAIAARAAFLTSVPADAIKGAAAFAFFAIVNTVSIFAPDKF